MKKCPRCEHEVRDDEKFCPHCGLDLQGRYRPIKQKNKAMTYLLYVIVFFSFITIPLFYTRLLNSLDSDMTQMSEERVELKDVQDTKPTAILATFDTLADFNKQFTNVNPMVESIQTYEATLQKKGYTFDKEYYIVILDNNDIYFTFTYTTKINDQLSITIERQYDRSHTYNTQSIIFKKTGVQTFENLFLTDEENAVVKTLTGEQSTTDQLMDDFKKRQNEFESKKEKLGHYGIGTYDGRSSFVAHRQGQNYYSELTYMTDLKDYIS